MCDPIVVTDELKAVAEWVFWGGPPWAILRNGTHFLYQVMDYGRLADARTALRQVPQEVWIMALDQAYPGIVSKRSYWFWSRVFGRAPNTKEHDWMASRHIVDATPRAGLSKERRYRLAERTHRLGRAGKIPSPFATDRQGRATRPTL